MHIHHDAAEAFYVLEGAYLIFFGGDEERCSAGSFIHPGGRRARLRVGHEPGRKLNLYAPAAMIGYFDEVAEAARRGDMDDEHRAHVATRYGMEITGPVPEGCA